MRLVGFSGVKARDKRGFDERWATLKEGDGNTPERRIFDTSCKVLLVFCVLHLLPLLYGGLFQDSDNFQFTGLSYVISGNWEKGVNIFAFTSCLVLLFALYVFMVIANRILYSIAKVSNLRTETVCLLLKSSLSYFCVIVFVYYGLSQFGIPTQALLASVGIITLAVSVGAKDLVNDVIAGFFILLEGDLKVGDYITVGGWTGTVQEIGLRTTRVGDKSMTKICNNSSLRDVVSCSEVVVNRLSVPVALTANMAEVEAALKERLPHLLDDIESVVGDPVYEGIWEYNETQAIMNIRFLVRSDMQKVTRRQANNRIKMILDSCGLDMSTSTHTNVCVTNEISGGD